MEQTNECKLTVKESSLAFLLGFVFCQLTVAVFAVFATVIGSFFTDAENVNIFLYSNPWGYLLTSLVLDLGLVGVFLVFNRNKQNKIVEKFSAKKGAIYFGIAVVSFFLLYPIITCLDDMFVRWGTPLNTISYEMDTQGLIASIFSLAILPAICEELLFRGLIFKGLKAHGNAFAILISSLFFALFHMSIDQLVYPFLFGMLLSCIMAKENNILYTIIMHLTNNLLSLFISYFNINLVWSHYSFIVYAFILLAVYLTLIILAISKVNKNSKSVNLGTNWYFIVCLTCMIILWIAMNFAKDYL